MIRTVSINDVFVEPIDIPKQEKQTLGEEIFPLLNANILIVAPKNSGKTVVIRNILNECADRDTHVIIFCATVNNDQNWLFIKDELKRRKIKYSAYTSIFTDQGINILEVLIRALQEEAGEQNEQYDPNEEKMKREPLLKRNLINFGDPLSESKLIVKPKKNKKYVSPDYIIIFDDLSTELKNPCIPKLMKIQRHFSTKIIISTQSYIDCDARIRKGNLDYVLLFKGISGNVLEQIYEEQALQIPEDAFFKIYYHATSKKYHFLFIDRNGFFRKDFNKKYEIQSLE
jgi:hypothetical protein